MQTTNDSPVQAVPEAEAWCHTCEDWTTWKTCFKWLTGPYANLIMNGRCTKCRTVQNTAPVQCTECEGSGVVEWSVGGDGYGGRCCGTMDVEGPCTGCNGKGYWYVEE